MPRNLLVLAALLVFSIAAALPTPNPALVEILNQGRSSSPASFTSLTTQIGALPAPDGDALNYWLNGHGRGPLHARGVSDKQIGVPLYPIDYNIVPAMWPASVAPLSEPPPPTPAPTPAPAHHSHLFGDLLGSVLPSLQIPVASSSSSSSSSTTTNTPNGTETNETYESSSTSVSVGVNPWPLVGSLIDASQSSPKPPVAWRNLVFASSTLGTSDSDISVTRGFAAVRNDGTEGLACISFVNQNAKPASEIDVDIEILDGLGFIHRVAPLRLSGNFQPNVEVGGPKSVEDVKSARENCVIDGEQSLDDPTDPFSGASAVVYSVRRVLFADGTSWLQPGANAWATQ